MSRSGRARGSALARWALLTWLCAACGCTGAASVGFDALQLPGGPPAGSDAAASSAPAPAIDAGSNGGALPPAVMQDAGSPQSKGPLALSFVSSGAPVAALDIACPATCADVSAAISGGTGPYDVRWDDGSQTATRTLCPSSNTSYQVSVSDAASASVQAVLSVTVEPCTHATNGLCVQNSSFEGTPTFGLAWFSPSFFDAQPWDDCSTSNVDAVPSLPRVASEASAVVPGAPFPTATDGATYLFLEFLPPQHQYVGQMLCRPLVAGQSYHFQIDLASGPTDGTGSLLNTAQLEVYASDDACQRGELLWTSPLLGSSWKTSCVTITPSQDAQALVLNPVSPSGNPAAALVDHLVPVDRCP